MLLHGKEVASSRYLDFMPMSNVIRASFDDLLLVSPDSRMSENYYICNAVTRKYIQLPKAPGGGAVAGYALVCMPNCSNNLQYQYTVVLIHVASVGPEDEDWPDIRFAVTMFCSKSEWNSILDGCSCSSAQDYCTRSLQQSLQCH